MVKDKFKLEALFQALDVPYRWENTMVMEQGDRTFRFNEKGEIVEVREGK